MTRTAEIAGGGIGGLAAGALLARQGWRVRVHEQGDDIREIGAGIYIKNNSLEVLEHLGVMRRIEARGTRAGTRADPLRRWQHQTGTAVERRVARTHVSPPGPDRGTARRGPGQRRADPDGIARHRRTRRPSAHPEGAATRPT